MKTFKIESYETVVNVKKGRIEEERADIIINWTGRDLRSGPRSFFDIHKKAGPALFHYTLGFESAGESDAFSTMPALLDCKLVVHSVIPTQANQFIKSFYNISETVKTYKQENLARSLSLYIPGHPDVCLAALKTFLLDIGLKEVNILYLTENEENKISKFLNKFKRKESLWEKTDRKVINGMVSLFTLLQRRRSTTTQS